MFPIYHQPSTSVSQLLAGMTPILPAPTSNLLTGPTSPLLLSGPLTPTSMKQPTAASIAASLAYASVSTQMSGPPITPPKPKPRTPYTVQMRTQFMCSYCGREFDHLSEMQMHANTHDRLSPLRSCHVCGKAYRTPSKLRRHVRTHSGEKPYSCDLCGRKFGRSDHVKQHMKVHLVGSKRCRSMCRMCGTMFMKPANLFSHLVEHGVNEVHDCKTCGELFEEADVLEKHTKGHINAENNSDPVTGMVGSSSDVVFENANDLIQGVGTLAVRQILPEQLEEMNGYGDKIMNMKTDPMIGSKSLYETAQQQVKELCREEYLKIADCYSLKDYSQGPLRISKSLFGDQHLHAANHDEAMKIGDWFPLHDKSGDEGGMLTPDNDMSAMTDGANMYLMSEQPYTTVVEPGEIIRKKPTMPILRKMAIKTESGTSESIKTSTDISDDDGEGMQDKPSDSLFETVSQIKCETDAGAGMEESVSVADSENSTAQSNDIDMGLSSEQQDNDSSVTDHADNPPDDSSPTDNSDKLRDSNVSSTINPPSMSSQQKPPPLRLNPESLRGLHPSQNGYRASGILSNMLLARMNAQGTHGALPTSTYSCPYCRIWFEDYSMFMLHNSLHESKSKNPYACIKCGHTFSNRLEFSAHMVWHLSPNMDQHS